MKSYILAYNKSLNRYLLVDSADDLYSSRREEFSDLGDLVSELKDRTSSKKKTRVLLDSSINSEEARLNDIKKSLRMHKIDYTSFKRS